MNICWTPDSELPAVFHRGIREPLNPEYGENSVQAHFPARRLRALDCLEHLYGRFPRVSNFSSFHQICFGDSALFLPWTLLIECLVVFPLYENLFPAFCKSGSGNEVKEPGSLGLQAGSNR